LARSANRLSPQNRESNLKSCAAGPGRSHSLA
jgi:hypothetical protein